MDNQLPEDWKNPNWIIDDREHNWKNYITYEVVELWHTFNDVQKKSIARQAQIQCDWEVETISW